MAQYTVSVSIAWDWENKPSNEVQSSLMASIRRLFTETTVDCYAREADDQMKVWVLQGTTLWNLRSFTMTLTELLPSFDIVQMSHHIKKS